MSKEAFNNRPYREQVAHAASRFTTFSIAVNAALAVIKGVAGYLGNSYALVADAVESLTDVVSSMIVWLGVKVAARPPSENFPYGKGRAETLAAVLVSITLFIAAVGIAIESIREIHNPHHAPAPYTLLVLVFAIAVKYVMFKLASRVGSESGSLAVEGDALHHQSDALTSAAACIGITIALIGGPGYESADDWAALFAAAIIGVNGLRLLRPSLYELIDKAPDKQISTQVCEIAESVDGVFGTHRCNVRKHGFDHFVELDILCNPDATIRQGHDFAHAVSDAIRKALPFITRVIVHVEPRDDYGRPKE